MLYNTAFIVMGILLTSAAHIVAAAPLVYFPAGEANEIFIVDAAEDRVVNTIPGVENAHGLAITPDGRYLIAGSLSTTTKGQVPPKPAGMSEEEHRAHHTGDGQTSGANQISYAFIVDTEQNRVIRKVEVPGPIHHVATSSNTQLAAMTLPGAGGIGVLNLSDESLRLYTLATGPAPNYAVFSKDGERLYVSNAGNNTISEIDVHHWLVRHNWSVGNAPEHLVLHPDGTKLYVNNVADGTVAEVDLDLSEVTRTFKVGAEPHGVDLSADGNALFVSSKGDDRVVRIDLVTGESQALALGPAPYHLMVVKGTGKVYVSSRQEPVVWVLDEKNLERLGKIPIRGIGHQMAMTPQ